MRVSYILPLLMVIAANASYHFISKANANALNPFLGLSATYAVAMLPSIALFFATEGNNAVSEVSKLRLPNFLLGFVVLAIESGWMLMYRSGWEISKGSIIANICVAVLLLFAGLLFFRESISAKKAIGLLVCIVGVYLINAK